MKKRLLAIGCAVTIGVLPASASPRNATSTEVAADVLIVRPLCFVSAIIGSVVFVATLPFTAPCCGVHEAADVLVARPGHAAFVRELGDMDALATDE
jgi:hypothetical protein